MEIVGVKDGRITDHWGVPHVWQLMQQVGVVPDVQFASTINQCTWRFSDE